LKKGGGIVEQTMKMGASQKKRFLTMAGAGLAAVLALSVPVFAISTVTSTGRGFFGGPAIEASDDMVGNGMRIVNQDAAPANGTSNPRAAFNDGASETVLQDWRYTRDKTGSPGS
jgi:hypothetical protein